MNQTRKYQGGCHCGAVRFEAEIDRTAVTNKCNCSFCTKVGSWGVIVKPDAFRQLSGEEALGSYQFNSKTTHHPFCKHCGVRPFSHGNLPELGGEYYSVNIHCLEDIDFTSLKVQYWDGRNDNWDAGPRSAPFPGGAR